MCAVIWRRMMFFVDCEKSMEDAITIARTMSRNPVDSEFDISFPNQEMCHLFMHESMKDLRKNKKDTRSNLRINIHIKREKPNGSNPY